MEAATAPLSVPLRASLGHEAMDHAMDHARKSEVADFEEARFCQSLGQSRALSLSGEAEDSSRNLWMTSAERAVEERMEAKQA